MSHSPIPSQGRKGEVTPASDTGKGDLPVFHRRGAPQTPDEKPVSASGATPVSGRESDSGNQPPFRTRDGTVTIWLYIIGEREVDGVCRAVFALHEQMDHGAGLAPEEVADFDQRERRGFVDRRDHVAFR